MGRPPKILSNEKISSISTDLDFVNKMIKTRNLTVANIETMLRHIDMVRDDLVAAMDVRQKQKYLKAQAYTRSV